MTTLLSPPGLSGLAAARGVVKRAAETESWSLTDRQLAVEVADAVALRAQADAVLLTRLGEADARVLARSRGASSMVAWLRGSHRLSSAEASRLVKTARALREQLPATAAAMADGDVHFSQAEVIVDSLKDLSTGIDPELRAEGEQTLIGACASLDPVKLGQLGRGLEELLDPEGVQARDEAKIREHEEKAFGKREFTLPLTRTGRPAQSAAATTPMAQRSYPPSWTHCPRHSPKGRMARRTNVHPLSDATTRPSKSSAGSCTTRPPRAGTVGRPRSGSPSPCNP